MPIKNQNELLINKMEKNYSQKVLVSIICLAYNHEKYIRECLEGFILQKTDFDFEVLIHDDASTDNTANIIREYEAKYPNTIKPIYQTENQWSKGAKITSAALDLKRAKGKYIAVCDGDDYWTDPYKLQIQVDFLEQYPNYVACFHKYQELENNKFREKVLPDISDDFIINKNNFLKKWYAKTLTALIRRDDLLKVDFSKYREIRDSVTFYELLKIGDAVCLNFIGGVYRMHEKGIWSLKNEKEKMKIKYVFLEEIYSNNKDDNTLKKVTASVLNKVILSGSLSDYKNLIISTKTFHFRIYLFKNVMITFIRKIKNKFFQ